MNKIRKVVHLADLHIRTFKLHNEYQEVFKELFIQLTDLLKEYKREEIRIVIAGDIFHQKNIISNEQLILAAWLFKNLSDIAPLVIIAGNHDSILGNKDRLDSITPVVELLNNPNIAYYKESKCYEDNNIIWCVYSVYEDNKRPDIESAKLEYGNDKKYIGLFHEPILNAKTDIGYSVDHGAGLEIFDGLNATIMGDIHCYQVFNHNGMKAIYSSSVLQQNYGENVNGHGFVLWDIETMNHTFHEVKNNHKYYQFKIKSLNDLDTNKEILTNI